MGTTILAVRYRDGVVVGADSRTSVSGYVSNRFATKISFVLENDDFGLNLSKPSSVQKSSKFWKIESSNDGSSVLNKSSSTCCICRSGSASDTQYIADMVRFQLLKRKIAQLTSSSISDVAHLIKNYIFHNSFSASLICAGYDHLTSEGCIFSIDMGGTIMEQPLWACNGSGSAYILGYIDENYKSENGNPMMTEKEALDFVRNAIELAMDRDGSSGGVVRIYVIDKHGKRSILHFPNQPLQSHHPITSTRLLQFAPSKR